jgi:hypothetical protein
VVRGNQADGRLPAARDGLRRRHLLLRKKRAPARFFSCLAILREAFESSPLLQAAPRITLWTSLKSARLKLWCEETRRMVGFPKRAMT